MASSLHTDCAESGFKCFWRIENFDLCRPSERLRLHSQRFKVNMLQNSEWHILIRGRLPNNVGLSLYRDQRGDTRSSKAHISVSILTCSGWLAVLEKAANRFKVNGDGHGPEDIFDWDKNLNPKYTLQKHISLPTESLTVCFHLWNSHTVSMPAQCFMTSRMINEKQLMHFPLQKFSDLKPSDFVSLPAINAPQSDKKHFSVQGNIRTQHTQTDITGDSNFFDDLEHFIRLLKEKKFRYVTLRTANKEFAAHKALLCARSPVFNAMFEVNMKENDDNVVDIDDIDNDTLSSMLRFLHLEPLEDLKWETAVKLFYAADKYQIEQLKSKCLSILKEKLSERNICEALVLADRHQDVDLKRSTLEFFCENSKIILRTLKWKDLMIERAELASEILSELAERM